MTMICLQLGDPSHDGHKISDDIILDISCTVKEFQNAYKESHENIGFGIAGVREGREYPEELQLCTKYENNVISPEIVQVLMDKNCPLVEKYGFTLEGEDDGANWLEPELFVEIFIWYVGQSLGFSHTLVNIPKFGSNGIYSMGYGLYSG